MLCAQRTSTVQQRIRAQVVGHVTLAENIWPLTTIFNWRMKPLPLDKRIELQFVDASGTVRVPLIRDAFAPRQGFSNTKGGVSRAVTPDSLPLPTRLVSFSCGQLSRGHLALSNQFRLLELISHSSGAVLNFAPSCCAYHKCILSRTPTIKPQHPLCRGRR
jgi:hypothetical protein